MTSVHTVSAESSEEDAIRAVVKGYCDAWNRHNMKPFADLFTDDAQWVNIVGMHWSRRTAIAAAHEAYHSTFFQATEIEAVEMEIREIAPGVAIAVVLIKVGPFTPPDGIPRPEGDDRLSLVLTRRSGRWRIAHGHNTVIDPGAQRFDPVKAGWPDNKATPA
jgi:uncharacterized protein (TIGR02246 family)